MKTSFFKSCTAAALLFLAFSACSQQETTLGNLHVIPLPQEYYGTGHGKSLCDPYFYHHSLSGR